TTVSANGLTRTVSRDYTGGAGIADGAWDRISVDQTVVNGDGSVTETITVSDGAGHCSTRPSRSPRPTARRSPPRHRRAPAILSGASRPSRREATAPWSTR